MDRMLYIAMTGAKHVITAQAVNSNNLANASTTGFRADLEAFRSLPLTGPGLNTRVYAVDAGVGTKLDNGSILTTGRDLDIAVDGKGWIAVQAPDGSEAYTRAGNLQVSSAGQLVTREGYPVLGNNGPIAIPPSEKLDIGEDGTVSVLPAGQEITTVSAVERIRLVNPDEKDIYKGNDGLMRVTDGVVVAPDSKVKLVSGALEGSNVNAIDSLVTMIELARQFEMHVKLMSTAKQNDEAATELLRIG